MSDQIPDELIVTFRKPIKLGEISYERMKLQEPTAAQWQEWDRLEGVEADIAAVATVAGLPPVVVRLLGARDLIQGARYIARFLG